MIKRALISVSDKRNVVELAKVLVDAGVEIISTGGTKSAMEAAGLPVKSVSDITGFPEILNGRVKTLHPCIHGGLLAIRDKVEHQAQLAKYNITPIDLVVVNLYPFQETVAKPHVQLAEAVENIDIGGPTMIRAAAKNFQYVTVVVNPDRYEAIGQAIKKNGTVPGKMRMELAQEAFSHTAQYDRAIAQYLAQELAKLEEI